MVHYIDDPPIGVRSFSVKGSEDWVQRLRQSFPIMTDEEVLARAQAARSDQARIEATYMLALIAGPELEEPIFAELKASLRHRSEDVRYAAILATGYTTWSALEEVLEELAARDESARVRDRAQRMLQQIAEHGWDE